MRSKQMTIDTSKFKVLSAIEVAQVLAKALNKPILYVSHLDFFTDDPNQDFSEYLDDNKTFKAAPYLNLHEHGRCMLENSAVIVCEDETTMQHLYHLTYGDDSVTDEMIKARSSIDFPVYRGEHRVYALTINANGEILTENT
jgi:hypothetical protein